MDLQPGMKGITPIKPSEAALAMIYSTLWRRMPNKSFVTGLWLRCYYNTPLYYNCFLHVLPVQKYKYFKYYFGNLILTTPGERGLYMDGTEEARIAYALDMEEKSRGTATADWNALRELETDLKKLYNKYFPITKGMIVGYEYSLPEQARIIGKLNAEFWKGFQ
jgi:hypothetical protein